MPSVSGAVEWGFKCCNAPDTDDPDFQGWYGAYSASGLRNMSSGVVSYNGSNRNVYFFDCMSFCNIAMVLGGGFPQYGDESIPGVYCYKGEGWGSPAENNSIAGYYCEPYLVACGFTEITSEDLPFLLGDVLLTSYDGSRPGHMEMVYLDGGDFVNGAYTMGAHDNYLTDKSGTSGIDLPQQVSAHNYIYYGSANWGKYVKWFRYRGPDEGGGSGGHHGGTGNNGIGNKHRAWLYLRNPRLYNLRR